MIQKVLVIGGTGMLGIPVVKKLLQAGFSVRVLSRNKKTAESLLNLPVEIMEGDMTKLPDLIQAVSGCQAIHINLSGGQEQRGVEQIIAAANPKGIEMITYISGLTVCEENRWYAGSARKLEAEKAIIKSGIKYHIFRPTWVFESLPKFVANGRASYFGKQKEPIKFVAADDYAARVATVYLNPAMKSGIYSVEGPEALTFQQALEMYVTRKHPEIKKVTPVPFWIGKIIVFLSRNEQLKEGLAFLNYFEKVGANTYLKNSPDIFEKPHTTLLKWIDSK